MPNKRIAELEQVLTDKTKECKLLKKQVTELTQKMKTMEPKKTWKERDSFYTRFSMG